MDKTLIELDDADHELIKDREYAGMVIRETATWQNMHLI